MVLEIKRRKLPMDTWFSKKKEGNSRWIQENSRWKHGFPKKKKETPDGYMVLEKKRRKLPMDTRKFPMDTWF
jgi:hypothetical protein